jgi:capsule polysaccharide export protein KpsE/RkpR
MNSGLVSVLIAAMGLIGGGGAVTVIQIIAGKHKTKFEAVDAHIKNAVELEQMAVERYSAAIKSLEAAQHNLDNSRRELDRYRSYILILEDCLRRNNIEIPKNNRSKNDG